jgi:hypothetical protein
MDPLQHLCAKINAENSFESLRGQQQNTPAAPPPYSPADSDLNDSDDESDDERSVSSPVKLTINAANSIHGSNNLVPTSPSPLLDAARLDAVLLAAVRCINGVAGATNVKRSVKVDLTINCGTTVVGDRNVIGSVGLKPKMPGQAMASSSIALTTTGAKRKAEDVDDDEVEQEQAAPKKLFTANDAMTGDQV